MPDWTKEIKKRLRDRIAGASQPGLIEELCQHLEDRYQELLSQGEDAGTARKMVLREMDQTDSIIDALPPAHRVSSQDADTTTGAKGSGSLLTDLKRDLSYGWRTLRKAPIFAFFAVLTLGLGIGATTTVFTIINTLLLHPLPAANTSQLAAIYDTTNKGANSAGAPAERSRRTGV
jgi:hypothetical protein